MLIIDIKESDSIDRALKTYKNKYNRTQTGKELRRRKQFDKPSIGRRAEMIKAVYREQKFGNHN